MRFNSKLNGLTIKSGIQVQNIPKTYTPTYVLGSRNGQPITVADTLKAIEYAIAFIKANFDVNQEKYSSAIKVLKTIQSILQNRRTSKLGKEEMKLLVDMIHEIEDMRAKNDASKKENEEIALALDLLIDMSW